VWLALFTAAGAAAILYGASAGWSLLHPGPAHYDRGLAYFAENDLERAEQEWQRGAQEDPAFPGCFEKLGDLYESTGNHAAAVAEYDEAAKRSASGTLWLRLARAQQELGDTSAAAQSAGRAAALLPDSADASALYGDLALRTGDLANALKALRRAHALAPDDTVALHGLAQVELEIQAPEDAERDIADWLRSHPDDAEASLLMARAYGRKPRTPESLQAGIRYAEQAVSRLPGNQQAGVTLARFYLDARRPKDALGTLLHAGASRSSDEPTLQTLMDTYTALGRTADREAVASRLGVAASRHERISHLKRTLSVNPSDAAAGIALARLYEEDGDAARAGEQYRRILRGAPHYPAAHTALAGYLRRSGKPDLAARAENPDYTGDGP
jgi:tetratricopeptide (TPR) repeat protein